MDVKYIYSPAPEDLGAQNTLKLMCELKLSPHI